MTLTQIDIQTFSLILGIGIALIVVFYILKVRRRRVVVPHVDLWQFVDQRRQATTLWQQLRRILSLLLQIAFVVLLAFALADPKRTIDPAEASTTVVVVDASATMRTALPNADKPGTTRFSRATALARALIEAGRPTDERMVLLAGAYPEPLTPFSRDRAELVKAFERATTADAHANLDDSIRRAGDYLVGRPKPRVVVISDGTTPELEKRWRALLPPPIALDVKTVGITAANVAISAFSVRRGLIDPRSFEVYVELKNDAAIPAAGQFNLYAVSGRVCRIAADCPTGAECELRSGRCASIQETAPIALKPGEHLSKTFSGEASQGGRYVGTLDIREGRDDFDSDNVAYAVLPERRRTRILHITNGNLFLKGLFALSPELYDATEITPARFEATAPPTRDFDVAIYEDLAPPPGPLAGHIIAFAHPASAAFPTGAEIKLPIVTDIKKRHPVLRWTSLRDLNIATALPLKPRPTDNVLVHGLSVHGHEAPLLIAREENGFRALAVGFDLRKSDLSLRVAFPLLIINAIAWFTGQGDSDVVSHLTGGTRRIPLNVRAGMVTVVNPRGARTKVGVVQGAITFEPQRAGFYEILNGDNRIALVAANMPEAPAERFSPPPATLRAAEPLPTVGRDEPTASAGFDIWFILVALALALTTIEWLTYHRRITV